MAQDTKLSSTVKLLAIIMTKCKHHGESKRLKSYNSNTMVLSILDDVHGPVDDKENAVMITAATSIDGPFDIHVQHNMCVADLVNIGIKAIKLRCKPIAETVKTDYDQKVLLTVTKTNNAFERMMAGKQFYPSKKSSRYFQALITFVRFIK